MSLVRHLPASGSTARADGAWGDEIELLVGIVEQLDTISRLIYTQTAGKRPPGKPLHVARPGEQQAKRNATRDRMSALLEHAEAVT